MTQTAEVQKQADTVVRPPQLAFWKPYSKDGKISGAAALFNFSVKNSRVYLEMRPQIASDDDQNRFDKDNSIVTMLGIPDIGEMLAVLRGKKGGLGQQDGSNWKGLYHQNESGSTTISLTKTDRGFSLSLGSKRGSNPVQRIGLNLSLSEGEVVLHDYLSHMLLRMF